MGSAMIVEKNSKAVCTGCAQRYELRRAGLFFVISSGTFGHTFAQKFTQSVPVVLNTLRGVAHLAADCESLALACRPKLDLNGNYQHWSSNPLVLGFAPCQHSGCRTAHELWWAGLSLAGCPVVWTLTVEPAGGLIQHLQVDTCVMFAWWRCILTAEFVGVLPQHLQVDTCVFVLFLCISVFCEHGSSNLEGRFGGCWSDGRDGRHAHWLGLCG